MTKANPRLPKPLRLPLLAVEEMMLSQEVANGSHRARKAEKMTTMMKKIGGQVKRKIKIGKAETRKKEAETRKKEVETRKKEAETRKKEVEIRTISPNHLEAGLGGMIRSLLLIVAIRERVGIEMTTERERTKRHLREGEMRTLLT